MLKESEIQKVQRKNDRKMYYVENIQLVFT